MIAGATGSGKSVLAGWLLKRSPGRWVILNPKHTAAYSDLPDSFVVKSLDMAAIEKSMMKNRFTIVNPDSREANPDTMDDFIMDLHQGWKNIGLCCDELYAIHKGNGFAGPGLLGWLTRGRELKQSFIGITQRPCYISQFLFSESDYICSLMLRLPADRKRFHAMTDKAEFLTQLPETHWYWLDASSYDFKHYGPVPIA